MYSRCPFFLLCLFFGVEAMVVWPSGTHDSIVCEYSSSVDGGEVSSRTVSSDPVICKLDSLSEMAKEALSLFPGNVLGGRDNPFLHRPQELNYYAFNCAYNVRAHIDDYLKPLGCNPFKEQPYAIRRLRSAAYDKLIALRTSLTVHMDFIRKTYS